jgi:hypothetical protein
MFIQLAQYGGLGAALTSPSWLHSAGSFAGVALAIIAAMVTATLRVTLLRHWGADARIAQNRQIAELCAGSKQSEPYKSETNEVHAKT